jgi:tRNA dimethylallyltransferase
MSSSKKLIIIAGPTGIGKSALAIDLALEYQTAVVSADSRQVYRQMSIGVGKPLEEEMNMVPHYLIGHVDLHDHYHAADFERDALKCLEEIYATKDIAILCGGTGLYIQTLCDGMDEVPPADMALRQQLEDRVKAEGIAFLQAMIQEKDPELAATMDMQNPKRLIRAAEVITVSGRTYTSFRQGKKVSRPFEPIFICLDLEREALYERIRQRVNSMLAAGWLEEAQGLMSFRHLKALQTVGYRELFDYLDGKTDWSTTVELIKTHTCQYARRQLTWFRRDKRYVWLKNEAVKAYLEAALHG